LVSLVVLGLVVARDTPFHMGMLFQTSEHQTTIEPFVDNRIHQKGHSRLLLLHDKFGNAPLNDGPSPFVSATVSQIRSPDRSTRCSATMWYSKEVAYNMVWYCFLLLIAQNMYLINII